MRSLPCVDLKQLTRKRTGTADCNYLKPWVSGALLLTGAKSEAIKTVQVAVAEQVNYADLYPFKTKK